METLIQTVNHPNYGGWWIWATSCADEPAVHALPIALPMPSMPMPGFPVQAQLGTQPRRGWFASRGGAHLRGTIVGHGVYRWPTALRCCVTAAMRAGYPMSLKAWRKTSLPSRLSIRCCARCWRTNTRPAPTIICGCYLFSGSSRIAFLWGG